MKTSRQISLSSPLRATVTLVVVLVVFFSYNFMSAAITHDATYTDAPTNPPNNNTPAPINVGTSTASIQNAGQGALQFDYLSARDTTSANVEMRSPRYCDENGQNCYDTSCVLEYRPSENDVWQSVALSGTGNTGNFDQCTTAPCGIQMRLNCDPGIRVLSQEDIRQLVLDNTSLPMFDAVYSGAYHPDLESPAAICEMALPGSSVINFSTTRWNSENNNSSAIYHESNNTWTRISNSVGYNRHLTSLTCQK